MKRICSLVLVLCMVLSMVVVPTLAEETTTVTPGATTTPLTGPITTIPDGASTVEVGGVNYTVIRTADDFKTKMAAGGNFILANDIDFGPTVAATEATEGEAPVVDTSHALTNYVVDATQAFTFDGNGYTLKNVSFNFAARASLFKVVGAAATVKNLKVTTGNVMNFTNLSGIFFTNASTGDIVLDNVDLHVTEYATSANNQIGLYVGSTATTGSVTFKDCELTGTVNMKHQINSGFVTQSYNTITITNCIADVTWNKTGNRNLPFIGEILGGSVTMTNCLATGTLTEDGGKWASPFVSGITAGNVTLIGCENAMNVYGKGDRTGGLIGGYLDAKHTSHVIIQDCLVSGVSWTVQSAWMAQVGTGGENATFEFKGNNKVTGYVMLGGTDTLYNVLPDAPKFENAVNASALNAENGEKAFYYAAAQVAEGITDPTQIYGQQIGVDATPVKGGKTVYRRQNADGTYEYANKPLRTITTIEIPEGATTVTYEGQTLTVVRTLDEFKAMTAGAYVLANDIDFTGFKVTTNVIKVTGNFTLYGNSHTLKNVEIDYNNTASEGQYAGIFNITGVATVKELYVEATGKSAGQRSGILFGYNSTQSIVAEGVHITADINSDAQQFAFFVGNVEKNATFTDCSVKGTLNATKIQQGGFIGIAQGTCSATFVDCKAELDIVTSQNRVAPFIGQTNAVQKYNFSFCSATGTYISTYPAQANAYGPATYIGCFTSDADGNEVVFDSCSTNVVFVANDQVGGFISGPRSDARVVKLTFKDCVNNAVIVSAGRAGAWVGAPVAATSEITVTGCINTATITGVTIVTVVENENATAKVKDLSGLSLADGSVAYALATAQKGMKLDAKYVFGQEIGKDAAPKMNGMTVYKGKDLADKDCYTNTPNFISAVIPEGATTYTVGGVTYNVIRTLDELKAMRGENAKTLNTKNYILANDIDLGGISFTSSTVTEGLTVGGFIYYWSGVLDGNGYSITNYSTSDDKISFFDVSTVQVDITVKNLNIGSDDAPIVAVSSGAGGSAIIAAVLDKHSNLTLENVNVYGDLQANALVTTNAQKGGFIGAVINGTSNESVVVMKNCTMNGKVYGRNKIAGFVGSNYSLATISMYDCVNYAEVTGRTQVGGFMGISQVGATVYFENCVNAGKVINIDTQDGDAPYFNDPTVGAIIGQTPSANSGGVTTLRNCVNTGEVVGAASATALVGQHKNVGVAGSKNVLNIYTNDATATLETLISATEEHDDVVIALVKSVSSDIADLAGLKAALAVSGTYTLTADITLTEALAMDVAEGVDVTIILAGKTITGDITVGGVGGLTIKNGTLKTTSDNAALTLVEETTLKLVNVTVEAPKTAAVIKGDLTAEDSTFTSTTANAVEFQLDSQSTLSNCTANGTIVGAADGVADSSADQKDGMNVTINGGSYDAVVWESEGALVIKGGTFEVVDGVAVTVKNGTVDITGGTLKGTNFVKIDPAADAVVLVSISGGEFFGDIVVGGANTIVTLSGGRYEKAQDIALLAKGYEFTKADGDTMYEINFHTHTYADVWTPFNTGSHKKQCTFPGCDEGPTEAHQWSSPADCGDGKHAKVCAVCNGTSTPQAHKLTTTDNGDGTHSQTCKECDLNATVAHNYGEATSIAGGKHEKACADCGNILTEDCTAGEDGKCACGADLGGTSGKKKGCKGSISGGLFVLLSVLAVPAVTVRKRRED